MQRRDFRRDWEARHRRPPLLDTAEEERRLLELDMLVEEDIEQLMRVVPALELPLEAMRGWGFNRFPNYDLYAPRGYGGWNMPEFYDGRLDDLHELIWDGNELRPLFEDIREKAVVEPWNKKKEQSIEQD